MKIHYKIALTLSALTAGLLVSCAKPSEPPTQNQANQNTTDPKAATQSELKNPYLSHVAHQLITPWYQDSLAKNQALQQQLQQTCGGATGMALQNLRQAWLALAQAWAKAEVVNFGMATDDMQHLYINFFPDERGLIAKELHALLEQKNAIGIQQLQDGSAIIQGIPAMEYVLFAHDTLTQNHCEYLLLASEILDNRLQNIVKDWQQNGEQLLAIGEMENVGINQWFNSILALLEVSKTDALDKPLAITGNKKGHLPSKFAKQSNAIFQAKLDVLNQIFADPQLATLLNDPSLIADGVQQIKTAQDFLATLPDDLGNAKRDEQEKLHEHFSQITKWLKNKLMPAIGARVGFNGTDGD